MTNPLDEYSNQRLNKGFRFGIKELEPIKPQVGLINTQKENKDDKIVCDICTESFFRIFFKEQLREDDLEKDPVLQDIATKKVFMKYDAKEMIYICKNNPEHKKILQDSLISSPKKILKVAGMVGKERKDFAQDFFVATERKFSNNYEIDLSDTKIEGFDPNQY